MSDKPDTPNSTDSKKQAPQGYQEAEKTTQPSGGKAQKNRSGALKQDYLTPVKLIAIIAGLAIIGAGILIFITGHKPDGVIFEMTNKKRFFLAALMAVLGGLAILYGLKHKLVSAFLLAAVTGGTLLALPFVYKDSYKQERWLRNNPTGSTKTADSTHHPSSPSEQSPSEINYPTVPTNPTPAVIQSEEEVLKQIIGYHHVVEIIKQNPGLTTQGIVFEGIKDIHLNDLQQYYQTTLESAVHNATVTVTVKATTHPINNKPSALVLIQHDFENDEEIKLATQFFNSLVIPSELDNIEFITLQPIYIHPQQILPSEDTYQTLTIASYQLLNLNRKTQEGALTRIRNCQKLINGPTILDSLGFLVKTRDKEFKLQTIETTKHWLTLIKANPVVAAKSAKIIQNTLNNIVEESRKLATTGHSIDPSLLDLIRENEIQDAGDLIYVAWSQSPLGLENHVIKLKDTGLDALLPKLTEMTPTQLLSASSIFKKNGRKSDIKALEDALKNANSEKISTSLRSTIDAIQNRP